MYVHCDVAIEYKPWTQAHLLHTPGLPRHFPKPRYREGFTSRAVTMTSQLLCHAYFRVAEECSVQWHVSSSYTWRVGNRSTNHAKCTTGIVDVLKQ